MKKQIGAMLTVLALVGTMLPVSAMAVDYQQPQPVTESSVILTTASNREETYTDYTPVVLENGLYYADTAETLADGTLTATVLYSLMLTGTADESFKVTTNTDGASYVGLYGTCATYTDETLTFVEDGTVTLYFTRPSAAPREITILSRSR